jgi:hypothetical protein
VFISPRWLVGRRPGTLGPTAELPDLLARLASSDRVAEAVSAVTSTPDLATAEAAMVLASLRAALSSGWEQGSGSMPDHKVTRATPSNSKAEAAI